MQRTEDLPERIEWIGTAAPERAVGPWRYLQAMLGAAVALFALGLYLRTLAPSVMPGDYAEFQLCAAVLGVPHPTGYPLYIMLGKLFTLLPFGDVAYRVNLSSAVYMAGAVGLIFAVGVRLMRLAGLRLGWWAAGVGALLFAIAPTVWSMSLIARSYALNALLVSAVLLALVQWRHTRSPGWFYAACCLVGLSMVHHGTTYLLLPAYGLYLLIVEYERRRRGDDLRPWRRRLGGVLALLLGFSPFLFLVYRFVGGSPYYWGNPTTWRDFFNLLTGGPFHNQVLGYGADLPTQLDRVAFGIGDLSGQYTAVGIALGVLGLLVLWRYMRAEAGLLTLMMLGNFGFAMNYALVGYLYFIPTFLIWGILISIGVGWLAQSLAGLAKGRARAAVAGSLAALAAAVMFFVLPQVVALRLPNIDQSGQTATRDEALALLEAAPQGAGLYLDWDDVSVIRFYRMVYGMRPDLTLHSGDPADWAKGAYCELTAGKAAFVGEFAGAEPPFMAQDFDLEPAPMGWRVTGIRNAALYELPACGLCATCR